MLRSFGFSSISFILFRVIRNITRKIEKGWNWSEVSWQHSIMWLGGYLRGDHARYVIGSYIINWCACSTSLNKQGRNWTNGSSRCYSEINPLVSKRNAAQTSFKYDFKWWCLTNAPFNHTNRRFSFLATLKTCWHSGNFID